MDIQNSQDFSYTKLKSWNLQITTTNMIISFVSYAVQYNKTLIRYSDNGRFIVPLDTNKLIIIPYTSQ
jgi:hypothetical protein